MRLRARRTIVELKPPQRPRSEVITTRRCTLSEPVPARSFGAVSEPFTEEASPAITALKRSA